MREREKFPIGLCRYGIALTGMSLAVLIGEGWSGPLTVMLTLALPPEIKSFAISLFFGLAQLIGPAGSVLFGIYLTVSHLSTAFGQPVREARPLGKSIRVSMESCNDTCTYCYAAAEKVFNPVPDHHF